MLEIRLSNGRGRGVFVTLDVAKGDILHIDHSRLLTPEDIKLFDLTSVSGHWFEHPVMVGYGLLPIGYSGLINHSHSPNVLLTWEDTEMGCIGTIAALRNIRKNTEIFINYGIDTPADWC